MLRRGLLILLSILVTLGFYVSSRAAPMQQVTTFPTVVTVQRPANLRAGPGTDFAILGGAKPGRVFNVIGCNADCTWYEVAPGCWIAAFLVKAEQPIGLPPSSANVQIPTVVFGATVIVPGAVVQTTRCPQTAIPVSTHAGPSTFYPVVDTRPAGECVAVIGRNFMGDWFQLSHGMWLEASALLYAEPITTMPVTEFTPSPTVTPISTITPTPTNTLPPSLPPSLPSLTIELTVDASIAVTSPAIPLPVLTPTLELTEITTVGEWILSTNEQKFATALIWSKSLTSDGTITKAPELFAVELFACVDATLDGTTELFAESDLVSEIAAVCVVLLN